MVIIRMPIAELAVISLIHLRNSFFLNKIKYKKYCKHVIVETRNNKMIIIKGTSSWC